jgi:hypothetical protein
VRFLLPALAGVVAYAAWRWAPLLLDPLGLGEFLFIGRFCLIAATLKLTETIFQRVAS